MNFNTRGMGSYGSSWQAYGYSGNGNVEPLIDSAKGRPAIVVGSSFHVFADLTAVDGKLENPLVFAVNDIGMYLPKVDHWVSLHEGNLQNWRRVRLAQNLHYGRIHTYETPEDGWYDWAGLSPLFALSGYFAMQIAYIMGCEPIVLCGCPGSAARRFFEADSVQNVMYAHDGGVRQQVVAEMNRLPQFKERVRSMSGWSQSYFGGISSWRSSQV